MAQQVREDTVRPRLNKFGILHGRSRELQLEEARLHHGHNLSYHAQGAILVKRGHPIPGMLGPEQRPVPTVIRGGLLLVRSDPLIRGGLDEAEGLFHRPLEGIKVRLPHDAKSHLRRLVVVLPELDEILPRVGPSAQVGRLPGDVPAVRQSVVVSAPKLDEGMVGVGVRLEELVVPPRVRAHRVQVLRVDGAQLPLDHGGVEGWRDEELRHAIEGARQSGRGPLQSPPVLGGPAGASLAAPIRRPVVVVVERCDREVVVCVLHVREGVRASAVPAEVGLKIALARVLLRPQEEHVLVEVGQAGPPLGILEVARVDVDRSRLDVRLRVRHQEAFQSVGELDGAVRS